jgi:hypothetical protein
MIPIPRLTILVGPARSSKTQTMLTMLADVRPLAIVVTDRTPAQFRSDYRQCYDFEKLESEKASLGNIPSVRVLADTDIGSKSSPFVGVQGVFVTDSPLSPIGSVNSDVQLLTLARMAIQTSADVFAEWSIFRPGEIKGEVGKLALKFRSPVVTKLGKLNTYVISGAANEIIASIGSIFNHLSVPENENFNPPSPEQHS